MNIPLTQSKPWADLQTALGKRSFLKYEKDFAYLAILESTPVGNYLYLPYGPVYETRSDPNQPNSGQSSPKQSNSNQSNSDQSNPNSSALEKALDDLNTLAREQDAFLIRIEPQNPDFAENLPKNARKSKDLNPKETWLLDLTGNDDDLKSKLPSRLLRYYRTAPKKGITIETSHNPDDIHYLLDLQKALASKKGINTFSENYLKTELSQPFATLYLLWQTPESPDPKATDSSNQESANPELPNPHIPESPNSPERTLLAAGLVFDDETTRYNLQGAQTEQGRKLHATGILTIKLILDAKEKGLKTFDFWGIAPDGAPENHPWAGFTAFKKTFAGSEKTYAGDYDLILSPAKYHLYSALRSLNRLRRKL